MTGTTETLVQASAFPDRCRSLPPAAGVKAGRRPPAGLGLDTGENGGSPLQRERPIPGTTLSRRST